MLVMAAAILLKAKLKSMLGANISGISTLTRTCIQICKGLCLYVECFLLHNISHKVFSRLAKFGVSVTHSTTLRAVEKLGENYDHLVVIGETSILCTLRVTCESQQSHKLWQVTL